MGETSTGMREAPLTHAHAGDGNVCPAHVQLRMFSHSVQTDVDSFLKCISMLDARVRIPGNAPLTRTAWRVMDSKMVE